MTPKQPKNQISELKKQIDELTLALQTERADATNIRRRAEEDRLKLAGYFKSEVIKQLLPFIDNFERALKHTPKLDNQDQQQWLNGLESVKKQLEQILESLGIKQIGKVGEPFNPKFHEAVHMEQGSHQGHEVITEVHTPGFVSGDDVLRHAVVTVSTK